MIKLLLSLTVLGVSFQAPASGLKTVDYQNKTTETQSSTKPPVEGTSSITPEQMAELQKNMELIKTRQAEAQKYLEELDKDE